MRRALVSVIAGIFLAVLSLAAPQSPQPPKPEEGIHCKLTGKKVKECCCEAREGGKVYCTLAKKTVEKCCCEPVQTPKPRES